MPYVDLYPDRNTNLHKKSRISYKMHKSRIFYKIFAKKFGSNKKMRTFAIPNENNTFEINIPE